MRKKLWTVLLLLTFVLGSVSIFWSKPVLSEPETKRKVYLCVAEPWGHIEDKVPSPTDDESRKNLEEFVNTDNFSYTNDSPLSSRPSRPDGVDPARGNVKIVSPPNWRFYLTWLYQLILK